MIVIKIYWQLTKPQLQELFTNHYTICFNWFEIFHWDCYFDKMWVLTTKTELVFASYLLTSLNKKHRESFRGNNVTKISVQTNFLRANSNGKKHKNASYMRGIFEKQTISILYDVGEGNMRGTKTPTYILNDRVWQLNRKNSVASYPFWVKFEIYRQKLFEFSL